jgi:hypothetical protein
LSLPRETLLELMAFADGELDASARVRAEKLLSENAEARRVVEGLRLHSRTVGAWLGAAVEARAVAADGVADSVMATIEVARDPGGVIRLAAMGGRRSSRLRGARTTAIAALAVAAAVAIYARSQHGAIPTGAAPVARVLAPSPPSALPGSQTAASPSALAQETEPPPAGVEVDQIDSPSRGVSVFEIPLGSAAAAAGATEQARPSSVVIWIDDEPAGK